MALYPGETVKTELPVCVCGHDIFFHDISVSNEEGVDATVGCCHEEGCKCPQFYCTQSWLLLTSGYSFYLIGWS